MRISIEDNLTDFKNYLTSMGHEVYNFSDNVISEAYIYSESNTGLINLANMVNGTGMGSLLIDADNKSPEEIQGILSHRVYSPLFSNMEEDNTIYPFKITNRDREV
jgi:hypothetical protein